ncbi:hypothetical protein [Frankia nepalensis]|uniref:hypothetical protein n=1 Tax=Frankia nepalensis TaxID=1836974 RepID=UPI0028898C74|nr:hypothetical protein [Frankia nepalensis]
MGPVLAVLLVLAVVGFAVVPRVVGGDDEGAGGGKVTEVRVLAGSETREFFTDPAVTARLADAGYRLRVDTAGSREIVGRDLSDYDIALPSNTPLADLIRKKYQITRATYVPFSSPIAVATFTSIADMLAANGLIRDDGPTKLLDLGRYLDLVAKDTRWSQLANNTSFDTDRSVLISSTDVRTSNSAALYLALASYVANGNTVVSDRAKADQLAENLAPLFLRQGYLNSTSQEPFDDYLTIGVGKNPMVIVYEAQFRERQIAKDDSIDSEMALLYPSPTIFAKHTVVPLSDAGDEVGQLLATDERLQSLAVRHGFRPAIRGVDVGRLGVDQPPRLVDVVEPPVPDISEQMIKKIDELYTQGPR